MKKIIILNQGTLYPSFQEADKAARETWGSVNDSDIRVIHYYGKYDANNKITDRFKNIPPDGECSLEDTNTLVVGTYDTRYPSDDPRYRINNDPRGEKFIRSLDYVLSNFEFDYLFRISCTSYVDVNVLKSYVETLPKTKIYNGARNLHNHLYYFVSGHCVLMSKDVVEKLVSHKEEYLLSTYPEDLAAGKILINDTKYVDFENQDNITLFQNVPSYTTDFSLRTVPNLLTYKLRGNFKYFYEIHKKLYG